MPIDKKATATWYNAAAPFYSVFRRWTHRLDKEVLPHAITQLELEPSDLVLDAGTGPGTYAIEIAKRPVGKVTGVDISPRFITLARKNALRQRAGKIDFRFGDLETLPFRNHFFDKLICAGALQATEDRESAARELHRVLKPGGRAVIVEPHKRRSVNDRLFVTMMYFTGLSHRKLRAVGPDQLTNYFFEEATLYKLLKAAGFSRVRIKMRSGTMCAVCDK